MNRTNACIPLHLYLNINQYIIIFAISKFLKLLDFISCITHCFT